jgi:hypothetical protein
MRHPFDGINPPQSSRRTWLGMLAALFGAAAVKAAAPPTCPMKPAPDPEPRPTTLAFGEEGGKGPPKLTEKLGEGGGVPTTKAIGEEGGKPPMSTAAIGEEGASTRALGEEGGVTRARGEAGGPVPMPTTLAIGEEGGGKKK